jgi:hypothetical protein
MIGIFSHDARRKRCVVERLDGDKWVQVERTATGAIALIRARGLDSYRISDDAGVILTVIDGQPVEAIA